MKALPTSSIEFSPNVRARRRLLRGGGASLALLSTFAAASASAQTDINPPLPNVMLLVDTSGSMEYKVGSTNFPTCYPDGSQASERSRWTDLVEVLTGSIQNYRCEKIDRMSASFGDGEYGKLTLDKTPFDYLYPYPYHRPLSGNCALAPGNFNKTNVYDFADDALKFHAYSSTATSCVYDQAKDGILDSFENAIRFGLMTFDPSTGKGTGVTTGGTAYDASTGVEGTWSYIWEKEIFGMPVGCTEKQPWEVGGRNAAAPPWEGRLVAFGNPNPGSAEFRTKKSQIERVLMSTRPYGPTPINGLMHDARDFLLSDTTKDPTNTSQDFGPYKDPWIVDSEVATGCRKRFVILLTDGQPNMDLRPECDGNVCPFPETPELIAKKMAGLDRPIYTYVVGFALSSFNVAGKGTVTCAGLTDKDLSTTDPAGLCNSTTSAHLSNKDLQACCSLNRIAIAGGKGSAPRAFFADNREGLKSALSKILTETTNVTSRTVPVMSGAAGGSQGFRFYSSVRPVSFQPWVGILQRQRYKCESNKAVPIKISAKEDDDFAANINAQPDRRILASIKAPNGTDPFTPTRSTRPYFSGSADGAGVQSGARYAGTRTAFVSGTTPQALNITDTTCDSGAINASACRDRYLNWLVGLPNGTPYSRCPGGAGSDCYLFGDILHSTPAVVGPPSEFLRDESYDKFVAGYRKRPVVLYTSTNDGFLHAFKVAATDTADTEKVVGPEGPTNNELWAFVPPAILPYLRTQYPFTHTALLDGAPVVRDVVATTPLNNNPEEVEKIRFERSQADTNAGSGGWRTVLLQSFGSSSPAGGGFFALDVTNPVVGTDTNVNSKGPRFLWQLTTDASGRGMFGRTGKPAIATLYFDPRGGSEPRQIPVALLPGGGGPEGTLGASGCPTGSDTRSFPEFGDSAPRQTVRCHETSEGKAARSLMIVRLDTGEIVRVFRQKRAEVLQPELQSLVTEAPIDSPITGEPVPFPAQVGAVSDRAYVGDQDGRLWRVNLASIKPADWKMELFFDAFPRSVTSDSSVTHDYRSGQPIVLPPVLSVDERGDITIAVATGDQETIGADPSTINYVWSLTERTALGRASADVRTTINWYMKLPNGERVVGPMSLFNSQLFFASFAPPASTAHACSSGTSKVWGMDYIQPANPNGDPSPPRNLGGAARLADVTDGGKLVQSLSSQKIAGDANAVIFGVSVAQEPSCSTQENRPADDFFGYGAETTIRNVNPGKFQLVMHVGGIANTVATGDQQANVRTMDLPSPPNATKVDSWAMLVE